jgi:hypothetical protein
LPKSFRTYDDDLSVVENVLRGDAPACIPKLALLEKLTGQVRQALTSATAIPAESFLHSDLNAIADLG